MPPPARTSPRRDDLRIVDRAGWPAVADTLIRGLRHGLAGSLTVLMGVEEFLRSGGDRGEVIAMLKSEMPRMRRLNLLLDMVPATGRPGDEVLDPGEVLRGVVALNECLLDAEVSHGRVKVDPDTPVAVWNHTVMMRVLLVLLDGLQRGEGPLSIAVGPGDPDGVLVYLTKGTKGVPRSPIREAGETLVKTRSRVLRELLERHGGRLRLRRRTGQTRVEVTIPGVGTRRRLVEGGTG